MMRIAMMALLVAAACSGNGDKPSTDTTVSNAGGTETDRSPESGDALLERLLTEANDAVYAATDDAGVQAAFDDLSMAIARADSITVAMIDAEIEKRNGHLESLHGGETRVYPDQRTMAWMTGVVSALEKARDMRAE